MMQNEIKEALEVIKKGGVALINTDTIPALTCDATNASAVNRLLQLLQRPEGCGLVVLASDMDMVAKYVKTIPSVAVDVAELSVSPITIVYSQGVGFAPGVTASDGSVAIRVPKSDFCVALIRKLNRPIVATTPVVGESMSVLRLCMEEIDPDLLEGADWATKEIDNYQMSCSASSIIAIGAGSEVTVLRK